ncbi:hypothetical protein P5673_008026 [Acropora cervicornis]|uniref:Endonuclease/exonuclease/phosphatase domain-containing protein n=1 Tax=Acropora cervicornis TaxID=6130 RepID=A0AAD9QV82_ACRCE|nr:hypothetical protein P5673_008026 [Acropora cervicornis]
MGRREGSRIKWTEEMNDALLQCKSKAVKLANGDNPPRSENGRKIGYMSQMKVMWDELGYGHLALSSQNLRDKAAALERTVGNVSRDIVRNVGRADGTRSERGNEENAEIVAVESSDQNANELRRRESANLHTESTQDPVEEIVNTLTTPEKELFERSSQLFTSVNASEGDYSNRAIDTRIKQTPTKSDLKTINKVINGLVAQNKVVPGENPFAYLWLANCVLYSVVVTFLVSKGWKKDPKDKATRRTHKNDSWKNKFLEIVGEVRKKLSIATAELSRIKENRKLTKRGKKNRSLLQKECRSLSASSLVSYIEKQKSLLRKLKVSFGRKRRQEEAKVLNRQFKEDPGRVYATITMMAEEDPDNARPKYKVARNEDQTSASKGVFSDIVEAEGFWRRLWEERGTGDENAEWLKEIEPNGTGGGLAVLYKSTMKIELLKTRQPYKSFELMELLLHSLTPKTNMMIIYRPPPSSNNQLTPSLFFDEFSQLLERSVSSPGQLLLCGDFNFHVEDPSDHNTRKFLDLLHCFNLDVYNDHSSTHKDNHKLDLVIGRSDEILVVNTDAFCQDILSSELLSTNSSDLISLCSRYDDVISAIVDKHAPLVTKTITVRPNSPWYTDDIGVEKSTRRRFERRWRRTLLPEHRLAYVAQCKLVKGLVLNAKTKYYSNLISESSSNSKALFQTIDQLLHRKPETRLPYAPSPLHLGNQFGDFFYLKISNIRDELLPVELVLNHAPSTQYQLLCSERTWI